MQQRRRWVGQGGDRLLWGAEMGEYLPAVDLGTGRSAVAVSAGGHYTCALLVRFGGEGSGLMMVRVRSKDVKTQISVAAALSETRLLHRVF